MAATSALNVDTTKTLLDRLVTQSGRKKGRKRLRKTRVKRKVRGIKRK